MSIFVTKKQKAIAKFILLNIADQKPGIRSQASLPRYIPVSVKPQQQGSLAAGQHIRQLVHVLSKCS